MSIVIVSGALANKCRNGGGAWERMSWVKGLRRLGCDVYFVEQIEPRSGVDESGRATSLAESVNLRWFQSVTKRFGVTGRSALIDSSCNECEGIDWSSLLDIAASADFLLNLSGHLTIAPLLEQIHCKAYIDVDPGFTQFWHADPEIPFQVPEHDLYFTIGGNIGTATCNIPTGGLPWRPIRQPIVLEDWPVVTTEELRNFTTVSSWRGPYGPVHYQGTTYGLKAHEFRKYIGLPRLVGRSMVPAPVFELALDIDQADAKDLSALRDNGWRVIDPRLVAGDPDSFQQYVQQSAAEFSVAQGVYVHTNCGWFSDRTVRYLASGKPVLVQDTGFQRTDPFRQGLLSFRTLDEAAAGVRSIADEYAAHCEAARAIAEWHFDSDKVLSRLLEEIAVTV